MGQTIEKTVGICPLCGEELDLDVPDWRISNKWSEALAHRDKWAIVSKEFRNRRSIEAAAASLSISDDLARHLLEFVCMEICGCRTVTCVSCLDDYRSEL